MKLNMTTGLETKTFICQSVYLNLELSVNEKFVAYMGQWLRFGNLKSPYAKGCYLIQKIESAIERVYLTC